ncbi:MAG: 3-dehydroquinate synthase [Kiritimatiellia bacterium]|jgi:3-dehydroquinate synthase|nr:3-dehydroquinate synthase [Kiritimatiellia bacterium]
MNNVIQKFTVSYRYPVCFTRRAFDPSNRTLATVMKPSAGGRARALAVVDAGVAGAAPGLIQRMERYFRLRCGKIDLVRGPVTVPGGEQAKNGWAGVRALMALAAETHLDRHSYLVAVGGGSVLDMAGFAASLVHRGLRLIRLPTTVLAQNDAGVGVKNGMNSGEVKNAAGTFAPPFAVINDFDFLATLPQREWVGGIAEAFKVAIIRDRRFFRFLLRHAADLRGRDPDLMETLVRKTAALHLRHIATSGDPFEYGSARPLDFGHWAAHRLESLSNFTLGHGEAVAVGIALDSTYAMLNGLISPAERDAILQGLTASGLPVWTPLLERPGPGGAPDVLVGLEQFREHLGGKLCVTLPSPLGAKTEVRTIRLPLMRKAIALLRPR